MGSELRRPRHILSCSPQKSNPIFSPHTIFFIRLFFRSRCSLTLFFLNLFYSFCLPLSEAFSQQASFQRQRGVCQVPNPWAERSKTDKETGDLLFYSRKAKMESLIDRGHHILPLFYPSSSFTHSILLSSFSLFPSLSLLPLPHPCCLWAKARLEKRRLEWVARVNE